MLVPEGVHYREVSLYRGAYIHGAFVWGTTIQKIDSKDFDGCLILSSPWQIAK